MKQVGYWELLKLALLNKTEVLVNILFLITIIAAVSTGMLLLNIVWGM